MIHDRLDIDHWKAIFPLPRMREEARQAGKPQPNANIITGPFDIAVVEQLREETFARVPNIERVPTDIFVWNRGETANRAAAKIGGLPYREAGKLWPIAPSGRPMNFVAQFCFADSRDIIPPVPGDLLLIFIEGREWSPGEYDFMWGAGEDEDSAVHFEWVSLGDFPLVEAQEVPETGWHIMPCWGATHRTWDYPTADGFAYPQVSDHIVEVFEATKIGGACPWIQGEEDIPGTYLCSLSSVMPEIHEAYPFLNVPDPIPYREWRHAGPLMIGDVGLMNIFVNSHGDVRWTAQGH